MAQKKKSDNRYKEFFEAFAGLPSGHKTTIITSLRMFRDMMRVDLGAVAFNANDVLTHSIFEGTYPLEDPKLSALIARLEQEIL